MTIDRCSNSCVRLIDGQELYCENTVEEIEKKLSSEGSVTLDLTVQKTKLSVSKSCIVSYSYSD